MQRIFLRSSKIWNGNTLIGCEPKLPHHFHRSFESSAASEPSPNLEIDKSGARQYSWNLGSQRKVRVTDFGGTARVDIREYYFSPDQKTLLPTRRGITLPKDQWEKLKAVMKEIDTKMEELDDARPYERFSSNWMILWRFENIWPLRVFSFWYGY